MVCARRIILTINDYIIIRTSPGERDLCGTKSQNERGGNDKNEKTVPGLATDLRVTGQNVLLLLLS